MNLAAKFFNHTLYYIFFLVLLLPIKNHAQQDSIVIDTIAQSPHRLTKNQWVDSVFQTLYIRRKNWPIIYDKSSQQFKRELP